MNMPNNLPLPARYFPIEKGLYEVAPGLRTLGTAFGNGKKDELLFQLDSHFQHYRENKLKCRQENLSKYYCTHDFSAPVSTAVTQFFIDRLLLEHPTYFRLSEESPSLKTLECLLTNERLIFDKNLKLQNGDLPYTSSFDALCSQVQEDVAVMCVDESGKNWLSNIHLCSPAHWKAEDKIGKNFVQIHEPVAGIEKINKAAHSIVDAMIYKGPYVRFVWGFATDQRLNHHPTPPHNTDPLEWKGRSFEHKENQSNFVLRIERQVLWGFPKVNAALFTIRIYFIEGDEIKKNPKEKALLKSGLLSMTQENRIYKGIDQDFDKVISWLDT